jgi:hypothetical protein
MGCLTSLNCARCPEINITSNTFTYFFAESDASADATAFMWFSVRHKVSSRSWIARSHVKPKNANTPKTKSCPPSPQAEDPLLPLLLLLPALLSLSLLPVLFVVIPTGP